MATSMLPEMPPELRNWFPNSFWNWWQSFKQWANSITSSIDPLAGYRVSDMDTVTDPAYYGFTEGSGSWYIMEYKVADETFRYVKGSSGYVSAWASRSSLTYDLFENVF